MIPEPVIFRGVVVEEVGGPEESALQDALPSELAPLFTLSLHAGLRWSEQRALRWQDVDVLTGLITVGRSKNGASRQVPMNAVVRSTLFDLGVKRSRPDDPDELIFMDAYRTVARAFSQAVRRLTQRYEQPGRTPTVLKARAPHADERGGTSP